MPALTLLIVLAFAAVLAALLALWFTVTLPTRVERMRNREASRPERASTVADLSNDAVRGAKAPRKSMPVDATAEAKVRVRREDRDRSRSADDAMPVTPTKTAGTTPTEKADRPGGDPFEKFLDRGRGRDEF